MNNIIDSIYNAVGIDLPFLKTIFTVSIAIIVLIIGMKLAAKIKEKVSLTMDKKKVDKTMKPFLLSMLNTGLKLAVFLFVATIVGVQLASLAAIFGAMVFAIGMALQGSLGHFASGILILVFKPYKIGDKITIGGHTGKVKEIQIFNTIIVTSVKKTVVVPNGIVTKNAIVNFSTEEFMRADMTFSVSYNSDIDQVRAIIKSVADSCPHITKEKEVGINVNDLGKSSVDFIVQPFCTVSNYWNVYFYMKENVKKQLDANSITIPYPQMELHMIANEN